MLFIYGREGAGLKRMAADAPLQEAIWIDLFSPQPEQLAQVAALGVTVPSLDEMEEIEPSSRLYSEDGSDYLTIMLPGTGPDQQQVVAPVTFILSGSRLITVRHHAPRPFETFADRAAQSSAGCASARHVFLGLAEEIIGRLADLLEGAGRVLDGEARLVYSSGETVGPQVLRQVLRECGLQGELIARVRLGLLTIERALLHFGTAHGPAAGPKLRGLIKALARDINALEVHADFLGSRLALITDTTLGMINLDQAGTIRIVSVMSVVFLPPTVFASAWGMNFAHMPELDWRWGYPIAIAVMISSAVLTWLFFHFKKML